MDLETRQLQQCLEHAQQLPEVLLVKPITGSTNDDVREIAQKGIQSVLVYSHQQTAGRGQRKHQWISPEGNIYLSTLLNLNTAIDGRLALEIALNILQMPSLKALELQIKWPNDLYSIHGKWGGILIEPISPQQVVVGVGLNIDPVETSSIDQPITALNSLGLSHTSRVDLVTELYCAIQQAGQWFDYRSHNLAARFNHHAAFKDQLVTFEHATGHVQGQFIGIANDGAVILNTTHGQESFYQGRLRLLKQS